jgi:hypothetical protein
MGGDWSSKPRFYLGLLIRANLQFIPIDSSYALQVADKLIAERRTFSKSLKLEDELRYLSDFLLHDCGKPWVMGVFGKINDDNTKLIDMLDCKT